MRALTLLSLIAISSLSFKSGFGQTNPALDPSTKEAYVVEELNTTIGVAEDGSNVQRREAVYRVTSEAGVQELGVFLLPYRKAESTLDVEYVRVRKLDGRVVTSPADAIDDMPSEVSRRAPEYSDYREKHVPVRGLAVGDTIEIAYAVRSKPLVPKHFWYAEDLDHGSFIAKSIKTEITVPVSMALKVHSPKLQPVMKEQNGRRTYTWSYAVNSTKKEARELVPPAPDVLVSTFQSWDEFGGWFSGLAEPGLQMTPELAVKAKSITTSATTDEEKVRLLYEFVASRIRYVGISFGLGRFQPHSAAEVLQNGFGDCKDKHELLAALLRAQGIKSYPVLLNVERKIDAEVPAPTQFDHVITVALVSGKRIWLDATQGSAPFATLGFMERDREALVVRGEASTLERTPTENDVPSKTQFYAVATLSPDGHLKGKITLTMTGDNATMNRASFRAVSAARWNELVQYVASAMGLSGTVSEVSAEAVDELEKPFTFSFTYDRAHYSDFNYDKRVLPLLPNSGLAMRDEQLDPTVPLPAEVFIGPPGTLVMHAELTVPDTYKVEIPKEQSSSTDFAAYESKISVAGHTVTADRTIEIKKAFLPQARRDELNKFRRSVYDAEISMIALKGPSTHEGNSAAQTYDAAIQQFRQGNLDETESLLRKVMKEAPDYESAHAVLAEVYMKRGDRAKASEEIEQELKKHPNNFFTYNVWAWYMGSLREPKEVRAVWERCVKALPTSPDAHKNLAEADYTLGNYPDAAAEMEKALALRPEDKQFQKRYARMLIQRGELKNGIDILTKVVDESSSAEDQNTLAYAMSKESYDLERAEKFAKSAVEQVEKKTSAIDLKHLVDEDLRNVIRLAMVWDTLGWVYYKEGKLSEAEIYLKAAFDLSSLSTAGAHLGQVYEKQGRRTEAMNAYRMAASHKSLERRSAEPPEKDEPRELLLKLASKESLAMDLREAAAELQRTRTTKLALMPALRQTGDVYFLFGDDGKLKDIAFSKGDESLAAPDEMEKIRTAGFRATLPGRSEGIRIVRRGSIFCGGNLAKCDAVLYEVSDVRSVNY